MKNEDILTGINQMESGDDWTWPEVEVWRIHDVLILFEIPNVGEPIMAGTFHIKDAQKLIDVVNSWT